MMVWETLGALTLGIIAVFTPIEVAFLHMTLGLFIFGRLVDAYFVTDMVIQFFVMVPKVGEPHKLETSCRAIAGSYLQGWFLFDVMALAASFFDILPIILLGHIPTGGEKDPLSAFRVVRVLRLIKLLRLVKASKLIKAWMVKLPTPRATITIVSSAAECVFVSHLFACFLGIIANLFAETRLDTWFATLGYCRPVVHNLIDDSVELDEDGTQCRVLMPRATALYGRSNAEVDGVYCESECVPPLSLYLQCMWWSLGMLMGAPISLTPSQGPYLPYRYAPDHLTVLTWSEQIAVLVLKCVTALLWTTVIARFVQVYNNLDPETREARMGWDALNRFVSYFKVPKADALELRRYYMERMEEAKAKSRKRVMTEFSPMLAEKFVWKLNKEWLIRVPCFTLVVQRLLAKPRSGMERFLVKVALGMKPQVFVPTERPPPQRLYIVTNGVAIYRGNKKSKGMSWGAEDVFLSAGVASRHGYRAVATTYLHVLYVGVDVFVSIKDMGPEFRSAFLLTKLWAVIHATGSHLVELHRQTHKAKRLEVGTGEGHIDPGEVEQRINKGMTSVVPVRGTDGQVLRDPSGRVQYRPKYGFLGMGNFAIVKSWAHDAAKFMYRVQPFSSSAAAAAEGGVGAVDEVERLVRESGTRSSDATVPIAPDPLPDPPLRAADSDGNSGRGSYVDAFGMVNMTPASAPGNLPVSMPLGATSTPSDHGGGLAGMFKQLSSGKLSVAPSGEKGATESGVMLSQLLHVMQAQNDSVHQTLHRMSAQLGTLSKRVDELTASDRMRRRRESFNLGQVNVNNSAGYDA